MKKIILNLKEIGECFDLGFFPQAMKLILPKRIDGKIYTLEKIGVELGITRERVRQKAMKIRNLLRTNRLAKDTYDLVIASFLKLFGADAIVALETVRQKFADYPLLADILVLIVSSFSRDDDTEDLLPGIFYVGRSGFIQMDPYDGYSQDLLKRRAEEMKPDYSMDEIQVLCENERIFLTHSGKLRSMGEGYLRNGTNEGNLILNLIEHGFPNGYRIYNSDDYSRFVALWKNCYGERELPSQNTVRGLVGRKWANVDKGTYLPRNDSLSIPDDLLGEMQSFAKQYEPVIYYISLFEEFKEDLDDLDIKNANQMKWLFDRQDHCFEHLRGYIRKKGAGITAVEYLDLILFDIEGIFTIEDIRKYLPHLPEFTFLNAISKTDSIMSLGDGKYVNCQDCFNGGELSLLFRETLKNEIKIALAKSLNSQVSVPALYGRFITIYPHLQKKLKKLDSPRGFAVAIKSICKRKYSISWAFLTPHGVESVSSIGFIVDYVRSKKSVTADEINSYALINGVRQIGFIDIFEMVSENYVMLEKEKLFSKDVVAIDQAEIDKARTELQFYLCSFGDIDSEQFRGFSSLPMIGFKWDVVSLLGFAISYCKDTIEYQIYKKDYRLPIYKLRIKRR